MGLNQVAKGAKQWKIYYFTSRLFSGLCVPEGRTSLASENLPLGYHSLCFTFSLFYEFGYMIVHKNATVQVQVNQSFLACRVIKAPV
jgi:hypothetical protein